MKRSAVIAILSFSSTFVAGQGAADSPLVGTATLNGVRIACDARTGGIVSIECGGAGKMIDVPAAEAGIVDLACPVPDFEPLRLAPRFSQHAEITKLVRPSSAQRLQRPGTLAAKRRLGTDFEADRRLTIHWRNLGASRKVHQPAGHVAATVTFEATDDGRSVTITCQIENQSQGVIRQVLFPDFLGLLPLAGEAETEFRGDEILMHPFVRLAKPISDYFYAVNRVFTSFPPRGKDAPAAPPWWGYGSSKGGVVLFARQRGGPPRPTVMLHLWERNHRLRIMVGHDVRIGKGDVWHSGTYVLTPFAAGWEEGMKPYHAWEREIEAAR